MKTLRDISLKSVPVVEPQTTLEEALYQLEQEPLKTVVLVGDGMYLGLFNESALQSNLIPPRTDPALVAVGPYVHPAPVIGHPRMSVAEALARMEREHQQVIPVVDGRIYKGVAVRADLEAALD